MFQSVIVIGAGASGLAAASKLIANGFENVTILEAENRIGGRIHSIKLGDTFVDLGAEEVHGEKGNVVVELAKNYLKKKASLTESICYYSDGTEIEDDLTKRVMKYIEEFCEDDGNISKSIGEAFTEKYNSNILAAFKDNPEKTEKVEEFLSLCESFFAILEGPFTWFDVVIESASHYVDCEGDQFLGWDKNGCRKILDILKTIPNAKDKDRIITLDDKIFLNKSVTKISYPDNFSETKYVTVECTDGTTFKAAHVIFTPSVGVLRKFHKDMFSPNLLPNKVKAFSEIGYSNVMKIALKFPHKWWDAMPVGFVWETSIPKQQEIPWITSIHWLMNAPENDEVLVAWLTGRDTVMIEKLDDNVIRDGVIYAIRKFLGPSFDIPAPDEIIVSRWNSNCNFCGTYSYETVEASRQEKPFQATLAEPIKNKNGIPTVLFAGEATHSTQYSTVNGAILTGYREAERLIEFYKKDI